MSHQEGPEHAVRALLQAASGDGPPTTDLLGEVRRRSRRRRALVPSLATVGALGVVTAVAVVATVTATPPAPAPASAQELVAAAVTRTSQGGYRIRVTGRKTGEPALGITEGVFDPARRAGRMVAVAPDKGHVTIHIGDRVYVQIVGRLPGAPANARWFLRTRGYPRDAGISELAEFGTVAFRDPQRALDWVRRAGDVRELGPASGRGWTGVRYAFELADRRWLVNGTVDVDGDGRVRRLETTSRATDRAWAVDRGVGATAHSVMEFWDFGTRVRVTAPPADQVWRFEKIPTPDKLRERMSRSRARPGRG
jgi:hypothetical protein